MITLKEIGNLLAWALLTFLDRIGFWVLVAWLLGDR
jgi:hypothetical protein